MSTPGAPYGGQYQPPPMSPSDEKLWATLIDLGGILFGFLPALIGYFVLRDRGPFIHAHTRAALNFQIGVTIAAVLSGVLTVVVIGVITGPIVAILDVIFCIVAAVAANRGQYYRYPLCYEFIKA